VRYFQSLRTLRQPCNESRRKCLSFARAAGSLELLAARSLALLRSLTDYERATFLDQACSHPATHARAQAVAARATFLAGSRLPQHCPTRLSPFPLSAVLPE
jgi:hypothetical protein